MRLRRRHPPRTETWTCPDCGAREAGSGAEGLWPPPGWQLAEADGLLARCPAHVLPEPERSSLADQLRWFAGPGL
jgi:hypothetical protein